MRKVGNAFSGSIQTGTFTGTMVGGTTSPSIACSYVIIGNSFVIMQIGTGAVTSNSPNFSVSGVPNILQTITNAPDNAIPPGMMSDAGVSVTNPSAKPVGASIVFSKNGGASGWTASGVKGINNPFVIVYILG